LRNGSAKRVIKGIKAKKGNKREKKGKKGIKRRKREGDYRVKYFFKIWFEIYRSCKLKKFIKDGTDFLT
jgi:endo-alpha-1,4-polygalactosaminidase (GH114 family)